MYSIPKGPYLESELPVVKLAKQIESLSKTEVIGSDDIQSLIQKKEKLQQKIQEKLTAWDRVEISRRSGRPYTQDYIDNVFTNFIELKGDRCYGDDSAIIAGFAKFNNQNICIVGQQKGNNTKESILRNFGMPHPEGYRKALRIFKLAEKFNIPIITLVDTPGAYPGLGAEERGQAQAIAQNLMEMFKIKVPIISIIIGEGASGGALGIGVCDCFMALENTWYCVISPEGCAAILWGNNDKKKEVAKNMKLTAKDLKVLGIADRIISEPLGGAHWNPPRMYEIFAHVLQEELNKLKKINIDNLLQKRIQKYDAIGKHI